jgi:flagellar biosynthesis GTPase FlhF
MKTKQILKILKKNTKRKEQIKQRVEESDMAELRDELNEFEKIIEDIKETESADMHMIIQNQTDYLIDSCEFYLEQTRDLVKAEIDQDNFEPLLNNSITDNVRLNRCYIYIFYSLIGSLKVAQMDISNLTERITILEKKGL